MVGREFQFRKKRELGEIINDSFEFLKEEIRPVFQLIIPYVLPFILLYGGLQVYVQMKFINAIDFSDPESLLGNIGPVYLNVLLSSLFAVFVQSLLVGTFYSYLEVYIRKGKNNFDLEEIKPVLFSNTLVALGANLILYFLVLLGVFMCILPGIYFANTLSPLVMVLLFEKKNITDGFSWTWRLVHSQWWQTFLLNLLGVVITYVAGFVVSIPTQLTESGAQVVGIEATTSTGFPDWYWVLIGISTVVSTIFWLVPYTFLAFQYFNLKERNDPEPPAQQF